MIQAAGLNERPRASCFREILADKEQGTVVGLGEFVGEAVAEVQRRGMHSASPSRISLADPPGHSRGDRNDLAIKLVEQFGHPRGDIPTRGNDHGSARVPAEIRT